MRMEAKKGRRLISKASNIQSEEDMANLRRGPWTVDEDLTLMNYITIHGEGRWNSLARSAGLKRTGKSCRLRWLNYLRPDVRRGNITLEEQLLILELHSRWGNRWSKIAQYLPGRTDNEIKNYWRTRVQKHAKQLKCDVNSKQFKDTVRYLWMPRLIERIQASAAATETASSTLSTTTTTVQSLNTVMNNDFGCTSMSHVTQTYTPENSSNSASSDSFGTQVSPISEMTSAEYYSGVSAVNQNGCNVEYLPMSHVSQPEPMNNPVVGGGGLYNLGWDSQALMHSDQLLNIGDTFENFFNLEDFLFLQQQLNDNV